MKKPIYSERLDLFDPNIYIQFLIQITGNPTTDELVLAVKAAFVANEATMSKIVLEQNGDAFYDKTLESGCKVTVCQDDWREISKQNEKILFAIHEGEFMRVFVIASNDEIFLFVMAHHLVGDGKSVNYFIEDVMTALSGESLVYKPMQFITKDTLPKQSEVNLPLKLYANGFNRRWKHIGRTFQWQDYYDIHEAYWRDHSSQIIYEYFSSEEIKRIRAHAKEIGVTVNSYLVTAFLEANRDNKTIGMAVDVRLDYNKSMSNQASGISVEHRYSDKVTFDENARRIHQKICYKLKRPAKKYFILQFIPLFIPSLIDSILLHTYGLYENKTSQKLAKVMGYTGKKPRELGITNLTKLDIPNEYGMYGLKNGLFIPPVVSYGKHIVGVSTMEDGMYISYHFMDEEEKEKEMELFKRAMLNLRKG